MSTSPRSSPIWLSCSMSSAAKSSVARWRSICWAEPAIEALDQAIAARRPAPGSIIRHSDRGVQYACAEYATRLAAHGIRPSMSRVGNPYDNAKADRFMRTL
ncbi:hypothetical protein CK231_21915 [Mesorhizobium loti]|uniref:DDE-type integrase/transposase/recombinase n=1 Tax=Rhizobium loti TaxID=381 RepID=UPI000BAFB728|nr:hypothetical protein CK231_21915 [Mesorhizobium loti]PBC07528.1 hypothetical protein CK230_26515 [Mesorhizobium sp. WSM3859]